MGKTRLLKSVMVLSLFYWVSFLLAFSFLPPVAVEGYMNAIPSFLLDRMGGPLDADGTNFLLDSGRFQVAILRAWTVPLLAVWFVMIGVGLVGAYVLSFFSGRIFKGRVSPDKSFRDINITLGRMPKMDQLKRVPVNIKIKGIEMTPEERQLFNDIVGTLAAQPDHFCGDGHGVGLYEHTLNVINKAVNYPNSNAELLLAAAAHDIGKLTSFVLDEQGEWESMRNHAFESARILSSMDSWWALDPVKRERLRLAVKYDHCPEKLPKIYEPVGEEEKVKDLIFILRKIDGLATSDEKDVVKEAAGDLPSQALRAFIEALPTMMLHVRGLQKGFQTCGLKKGNRVFLFEAFMREHVMNRLSSDLKAALGGTFRQQGHSAEFTHYLMKAFHREGWLVTELECSSEHEGEKTLVKVKPEEAFWDVMSGKSPKNGVIIVDFPPDIARYLPEQETIFTVWPTGARKIVGSGATSVKKKSKGKSSEASLKDKDKKPGNESAGNAEGMGDSLFKPKKAKAKKPQISKDVLETASEPGTDNTKNPVSPDDDKTPSEEGVVKQGLFS